MLRDARGTGPSRRLICGGTSRFARFGKMTGPTRRRTATHVRVGERGIASGARRAPSGDGDRRHAVHGAGARLNYAVEVWIRGFTAPPTHPTV
ncbi:MAG: hypothetical protein D6725_01535 [Planctomycetota bacterium]|nr:MAG: hypothetical protein D6725_01535 [Planctomycetota bacterium]